MNKINIHAGDIGNNSDKFIDEINKKIHSLSISVDFISLIKSEIKLQISEIREMKDDKKARKLYDEYLKQMKYLLNNHKERKLKHETNVAKFKNMFPEILEHERLSIFSHDFMSEIHGHWENPLNFNEWKVDRLEGKYDWLKYKLGCLNDYKIKVVDLKNHRSELEKIIEILKEKGDK